MSASRTTSGARARLGRRRLLLAHLVAVPLPESRRLGRPLAGREHVDGDRRRLPLEDRLRHRQPVVAGGGLEDRVQREVLALQRVHHLVRQHQPELRPVGTRDAEQGRRVGIVSTPPPVRRTDPAATAGARVSGSMPGPAVHALQPARYAPAAAPGRACRADGPHLVARTQRRAGRCPEGEPRRALDGSPQAVHQTREVGVVVRRAALAAAGRRARGEQHRHRSHRRPRARITRVRRLGGTGRRPLGWRDTRS